jgi:hypothetical protein
MLDELTRVSSVRIWEAERRSTGSYVRSAQTPRGAFGETMSAVRGIAAVSSGALGVLMLCLSGCTSSPTTPASRGSLPVKVTSVTATLTPYNPQYGSSGIPAEQIDFVVGGSPSGPFACTIRVWHESKLVGITTVSALPPAEHQFWIEESWPMSVKGDTFAGTPSDARVTCHTTS